MDEIGLKYLEELDFNEKGEAFVEDKFITPIFSLLGYDQHKDYEVKRHGDKETSFKLHYPPVEKGAKRVKHYHPDYIPTIRKKVFWIIEVKSPEISYPFDYNYIVQGLQYCIHPEIQAKYLILSNGLNTAIYDPYESVFFEKDIYKPIFHFSYNELCSKWIDISNLLSTEKIRGKIEIFLQSFYEKTCLSSLDQFYPKRLLNFIGENKCKLENAIIKKVNTLKVQSLDNAFDQHQMYLASLTPEQLFNKMDFPFSRGMRNEAFHYIEKIITIKSAIEIFEYLKNQYDDSKYFKKLQIFAAICRLYKYSTKNEQHEIKEFLLQKNDEEMSLINKTETIFLRILRKKNVIELFPKLRKSIDELMKTSPEIIRFTQKPSSLDVVYSEELKKHHSFYLDLKRMDNKKIEELYSELVKIEEEITPIFENERKQLREDEKELGSGFEYVGLGNPFLAILSGKGIIHKIRVSKK